MGRGETRGSDSENMRREKVRELIEREREREKERERENVPKKNLFPTAIEAIK